MNYNEFIKRISEIKRFGNTPNLLVVSEILKKLDNPEKNLKFILKKFLQMYKIYIFVHYFTRKHTLKTKKTRREYNKSKV